MSFREKVEISENKNFEKKKMNYKIGTRDQFLRLVRVMRLGF